MTQLNLRVTSALNDTNAVSGAVILLGDRVGETLIDTVIAQLDAVVNMVRNGRQIPRTQAGTVTELRTNLDTLLRELLVLRDDAITDTDEARTAGTAWWSALIPWFRSHLRTRAVQSHLAGLGVDEVLAVVNGARNVLAEHGTPAGFLSGAVCTTLYTALIDLQNILAQR